SPGDNPWAALPSRELAERGHVPRPDPEAPGQFAWGRLGLIGERLDAAGFAEYEVDVVDFLQRFESFDDWIATQRALGSRLRDALDDLDPAERDDVIAAVREQALPFAQDDGSLLFPARTWVAWASS
ncbi:MAG: hypothetical protein ACJ8NR_01400, partial [Sulfurifustis sp.]